MFNRDFSENEIIWISVIFLFILVYIFVSINFIFNNYWWTFPLFIYLIVFLLNNFYLKRKEILENSRISIRKSIFD